MIKIISLASSLSDSCKNRITLVYSGNVSYKLLQKHRFAHPSASKEPDLNSFDKRCDEVNNFNSSLKYLYFSRLFRKSRGFPVNRPMFFYALYLSEPVYRITEHIKHAAKSFFAYRHRNRFRNIFYVIASAQS